MNKTFLSRTIWGSIIILLGLGFLLNSFDVISFSGVIATYWPLLIIILGISSFINNPKNYIVPMSIVLIGVLFQLDRLDVIDVNVWQVVWPIAIIAIGLTIILNRPSASSKIDKSITKDNKTDLFAILSGIENKVDSFDYRGGQASSVLGGISIDLSKANIKGTANLNLFACLGGIELRVPDTWRVNVSGTPLLGGWDNKTVQPKDKNAPTLSIEATCIMGGIEIKN